MQKQCKNCKKQFTITDQDKDFLKQISPEIDGEVFVFPASDLCVECSKQNRLIRRNERKLYKRKCDFSGASFVTNISPNKPNKVYKQDVRLSDKRDPLDYGFAFDFESDFFPQLYKLLLDVPIGILNYDSENSDYVAYGTNNKDCYLCYCASYNRNCYYSRFVQKSEDCMDSLFVVESKNCYECVDVTNCFDVKYVYKSENCSRSMLLINCDGCNNCFGCRNLNNQQYYLFNKQISKEEYKSFIDDLTPKAFQQYQQEFEEKISTRIVKNLDLIGCQNCTGDHLNNSKNCLNCFDGLSAEDCQNCNDFGYGEYMHNVSYVGYEVKYAYEVLAAEQLYKCAFCIGCVEVKHCYYSMMCTNCEYCFGCVGLKHKKYCVFNTQYTKEEYEELLKKIITHMQKGEERGSFFPQEYTIFDYNETLAQEYYPLTRKEALEKGYKRMDKEYPINIPEGIEIIDSQEIESLSDEQLLKVAIRCEESGKPFRIIKPELVFYYKHNITIPTTHPDVRHQKRSIKRNPQILRQRSCDKCGIAIQTSYAPERTEKVYCAACYDKEIY